MTRFRLALWISALTLFLLSGCNCFDKHSWFRRPCCPESNVALTPAPIIPGGPVETMPYSPAPAFGSGYYGPIIEAPGNGCNKGCGTPGLPTSIAGASPLLGAPNGATFGNFPVISAPPPGTFPGAGFPSTTGPILTNPPTGTLPGPTTVEPPPAGGLPRLDPVPTPTTPPARPTEADPTSRTRR